MTRFINQPTSAEESETPQPPRNYDAQPTTPSTNSSTTSSSGPKPGTKTHAPTHGTKPQTKSSNHSEDFSTASKTQDTRGVVPLHAEIAFVYRSAVRLP